jgi:arylsulfatase A-like enzyme
MVLNIDLAPTLYDLSGLKAPDALDGRSLRPIFAGRGRASGASGGWRKDAYIEWQGAEGAVPRDTPGYVPAPAPARPAGAAAAAAPARPAAPPIPTWRAVRTRTHKFAVYLNGDLTELYDLRADPKETRNLIHDSSQKKRVEEMHRRLLQLADETKDPLRSMLPSSPSLTRLTAAP